MHTPDGHAVLCSDRGQPQQLVVVDRDAAAGLVRDRGQHVVAHVEQHVHHRVAQADHSDCGCCCWW
jgi:hypothetical protein